MDRLLAGNVRRGGLDGQMGVGEVDLPHVAGRLDDSPCLTPGIGPRGRVPLEADGEAVEGHVTGPDPDGPRGTCPRRIARAGREYHAGPRVGGDFDRVIEVQRRT